MKTYYVKGLDPTHQTRNVHGIGSKGSRKQCWLVVPSKKPSNFGLTRKSFMVGFLVQVQA